MLHSHKEVGKHFFFLTSFIFQQLQISVDHDTHKFLFYAHINYSSHSTVWVKSQGQINKLCGRYKRLHICIIVTETFAQRTESPVT